MSGFQVTRDSVPEQIRDEVLRRIQTGRITSGMALPSEREMAEEFGVSRNTIRQVNSALEVLGIVSVRQGAGAFVRLEQSEESIDRFTDFLFENDVSFGHAMQVRELLEPEAAALAAIHRSHDDLENLRRSIAGGLAIQMSTDDALSGPRSFHRAISDCTGNPVLKGTLRPLVGGRRSLAAHLEKKGVASEVFDEDHHGILEAITASDADLARILMREHLQRLSSLVDSTFS